MTYAARTSVPIDRTKSQIESILVKHKADQFAYGWDGDRATLGFRMLQRHVRFIMPLSSKLSDQQTRSRWRALFLIIKAKLESVQSGIVTFEEEFLAHIILPNNTTVGQCMIPRLKDAYSTGKMPALLLTGEVRE